MSRAALLLVAFVLVSPLASAEFGRESEDGWPIGAGGEVLRPPMPGLDIAEGSPLNKAGPFTVYPYYPVLTAELQRLASDHPDLVRLTSAGTSTVGLDLWLLEIADFARVDAGEGIALADREVIYIDGGTHSNEYSGVYFVTEIAQFLLDGYATNETAKWIVENRHVWILPMVNPDGSNGFGRLNGQLVNVNRNFPGSWGTVDEDPIMNNPGPEPASEPETKAVIALLDTIRPDYVNSIHCCGNLWLHPWGAEEIPPAEDLQMFTRVCDEVFAEVRESCGPIWSTIYPASGTTADEGYARLGAASWSYEMSGRGAVAPWGQPGITEDVRVQEHESWNGIMHALLHVEKYGARPEIVAVAGDEDRLDVTIRNVGWGNLTYGNLSAGGASFAIPSLAPGETAVVTLAGSFAPRITEFSVDWEKRQHLGPQGRLALDVPLVREGGGLVGILGESDIIIPAATADKDVPGAAVGLIVGAIALLALLRRR